MNLHMGLDLGSTTVKLVITDRQFNILHSVYIRHKSDIKETVRKVLIEAYEKFKDAELTVNVTGSGGMFLADYLGIDFVQEVIAETRAIREYIADTDVVIELGGEDSKITYLSGSVEQRMNSICAGGTGAFIDQMAALLDTDASGLNELAKAYKKVYPIASRCGVFAKTDIQALMNEGASKEDIAISVFQSVVNQTISNLACGRPIKGNISFLGGPLHFLSCLRDRFIETLGEDENTFVLPDRAEIYVALGAAILSSENPSYIYYEELIRRLARKAPENTDMTKSLDALFKSEDDYRDFKRKHATGLVAYKDIHDYEGAIFVGIDAGSTTSKMVWLTEDREILLDDYRMNLGKPLEVVISMLKDAYIKKNPKAYIASSGICGYGEDFIKKALHVDYGEVETIAHYKAAHFFNPKVDFILDIGGQDMKAMHIKDGIIDSIQLNEACSSGCGSFLSTFAQSVGMSVEEFQQKAILSKKPVDLGSRCTVFMNSKVKQAQKEGAEVEDIAAGLCYSVIKNAIQKVIKVRDPRNLGDNLIVQGGNFYGDAILRAFEKITGRVATRPEISGLMGAMGMALIARDKSTGHSGLADINELEDFTYEQKNSRCGRCSNNCSLIINIFPDGSRYITGNRCERGAGIKQSQNFSFYNMYKYKYDLLFNRKTLKEKNSLGRVGIPRVLNMYEDYPFWHRFFTSLGFDLVLSDRSSRKIYEKGIASISSETACYPAITVVGQLIEAVKSGRYNTEKLALLMTQSGGACRASNYVGYIRKGLKDAGLEDIPVIALSAQGIEKSPGFNLNKLSSLPLLKKLMRAILLGDLINRVSNATRPYEKNKGETNKLKEAWIYKCKQLAPDLDNNSYKQTVEKIVADFDTIARKNIKLPKAGIVGEILVKFLPEANNHLLDILEKEGAEVILPDLTDFLMYCMKNTELKAKYYGKEKKKAWLGKIGISLVESYRKPIRTALRNSKNFTEPCYINDIADFAKNITSLGNQAGEGWLLAGEMVELIKQDAPNIVVIQPFGCLPNHITGKGVMKKIRATYKQANIVAIDYDPGASEVNQINRVKLMMATAREKMRN